MEQLSTADRAFIASSARTAIAQVFAHAEAAGHLDLDTEFRALLDRALSHGDRASFSLEMAAFMASLRNGHTLYQDPVAWAPRWSPVGFSADHLEGAWTVTETRRADVPVGSLVERVGGEATEDLYLRQHRYLSASNERARRHMWWRKSYLFPPKASLKVDGRAVRLRPASPRAPPVEKTRGRWVVRGKVAYLRIPAFGPPEHEHRAAELVRRFRSSPALVVDVRGNRGGSTPGQLLGALMSQPWRGWAESSAQTIGSVRAMTHLLELAETKGPGAVHLTPEDRATIAQFRTWDRVRTLFPPELEPVRPGAYAGRVVLLTDRGSGSACEDFVMPFKDTGRGILVGETTNGSTGQPYRLGLKDGIQVYVGAKRAYFPDGSPFEGRGIRPDREVPLTREDLLAGRDATLDVGIDAAS